MPGPALQGQEVHGWTVGRGQAHRQDLARPAGGSTTVARDAAAFQCWIKRVGVATRTLQVGTPAEEEERDGIRVRDGADGKRKAAIAANYERSLTLVESAATWLQSPNSMCVCCCNALFPLFWSGALLQLCLQGANHHKDLYVIMLVIMLQCLHNGPYFMSK